MPTGKKVFEKWHKGQLVERIEIDDTPQDVKVLISNIPDLKSKMEKSDPDKKEIALTVRDILRYIEATEAEK